MKRITLSFFLPIIFSLTFPHLTQAQNPVAPLTATVLQDEAGLKQGLENKDFKFYLNGLNEEQFNLLEKNAVFYIEHFTVQIKTEVNGNKDETECHIIFLNNDVMGKRVLTRYFMVNTINTVLFEGATHTAEDFFKNYMLVQ